MLVQGHKCKICNEYGKDIMELMKHYQEHNEEDKILLEEYTKKNKDEISTISLYNTEFYKTKKGIIKETDNNITEEDLYRIENPYCCHLCNERYDILLLLQEHNKTH